MLRVFTMYSIPNPINEMIVFDSNLNTHNNNSVIYYNNIILYVY